MALELEIYQEWLLRAVNLSPAEKNATLAELLGTCGVDPAQLSIDSATVAPFDWVDWAAAKGAT